MNRRNFLKKSLMNIGGAGSLMAMSSQFQLVNAAAAGQSFGDYKALVCIFLHGGNDSLNMVIPTGDGGYAEYADTRQNLAVAQHEALAITPQGYSSGELGFHPALASLESLFSQGTAAMVANMGTLIEPVTRADILAGRANLPPQLFSHSDQQKHWQSGIPQAPATSGWAGRMADMVADLSSPLAMNMSLGGYNLWQSGSRILPYTMGSSGAQVIQGIRADDEWQQMNRGLLDQITAAPDNLFGRTYGDLMSRTRATGELVNATLAAAPQLATEFPQASDVAAQLQTVARMIAMQSQVGHSRQIYFVGMGGWDTHDNQQADQPLLYSELADAIAAFYQATEELGMAEQVTTFTASDFGRTLTSNGDGTDHGWGGHHFVIGGAVQGNRIYGDMPAMALETEDDYGDGRIIPKISVDQYAATLASWFGLSSSQIDEIFPNLTNFNQRDLGFLV